MRDRERVIEELLESKAFNKDAQGYYYVYYEGKRVPVHKLVVFLHTGKWEDYIVFKDGNKENIDISNLIVSSKHHSRPHRKGAGCEEVKRKNYSKWKARIRIEGKLIYLGLYDTYDEAHEVYLREKAKIGYVKQHNGHRPRSTESPMVRQSSLIAQSRKLCDCSGLEN